VKYGLIAAFIVCFMPKFYKTFEAKYPPAHFSDIWKALWGRRQTVAFGQPRGRSGKDSRVISK